MPFHMHTTCTRVWMTYNVNPLSDHVTFKQRSSYTYISFWLLYFVVSLYVLYVRTYRCSNFSINQINPRSKKLLTDEGSNILIYLTGHGGNGFLKFQDSEEITSKELADALEQMWQKRRYHEILFIVDTCQASSMYEKFYSPNILAVASSLVGEDSLSHHLDPAIGVYIIDRYTYYALDFLEKVEPFSTKTLGEFLRVCPKYYCLSTVGVRRDLFRRDPDKVPVTDFFGSLRPIELTTNIMNVLPVKTNKTKAIELERKYSYVA